MTFVLELTEVERGGRSPALRQPARPSSSAGTRGSANTLVGMSAERAIARSAHRHEPRSLNRSAFSATTHCLTGCAIGEVLGMVIATALDWGTVGSIALAVVLAFFFGYSLTLGPVLRAAVPLRRAIPLAFASDTASITVMEIVDNAFILLVPGAIEAGLDEGLFWWSLGVSLLIAFVFAFPLNRWLIARGRGHAVVHAYHAH
jgi:Domain of unknown function (DUF4396)